MITKIISGLLGVSLALSSSSVLAEPVYVGQTNEGQSLFFYPDSGTYQGEDNLLVFEYRIGGKSEEYSRGAFTPWCTGGRVELHPYATSRPNKPGWFTMNRQGEWIYIKADSLASKNLLKTACETMEFNHAEATKE